jgi:hypothetical protein
MCAIHFHDYKANIRINFESTKFFYGTVVVVVVEVVVVVVVTAVDSNKSNLSLRSQIVQFNCFIFFFNSFISS